MKTNCTIFVLVLTLIMGALSIKTSAQSAVFAVPSTDIQDKKTIYIEADFFGHFDSYENEGFQTYGPSVVYGVNKRLEVGVNYYYTRDSNGSGHELQPNIKWKAIDQEEKSGVTVAFGSVAFVPLNKVAGEQTSAMFYGNASKTFKRLKKMKITGGVYTFANTEADFGTKTGALFGFEQPLNDKFTFVADWTSGKNRLGYSNVGIAYESEKHYFAIGYAFGNSGRGNNYLSAFYGITF